ncbi:MAG TPA: hypothetical protein VEY10_04890 [Flavisolibacter sp.]|jgi:hypothetical protein|nr:hypothetical protein [Flavisolibacter sp.]
MRRIILALGTVTILAISLSSCTAQRDCYGVKHTTLSNGVRI